MTGGARDGAEVGHARDVVGDGVCVRLCGYRGSTSARARGVRQEGTLGDGIGGGGTPGDVKIDPLDAREGTCRWRGESSSAGQSACVNLR